MANSNVFFKVLPVVLQAAAEVESIQPLHDEARFNAIKEAATSTIPLAVATFFPNDKLATAISGAAIGAISSLTYDEVVNPKPSTPDTGSASTTPPSIKA